MVLNNSEQRNLFSMLESGYGGSSGGGAFVLRGTDLIAVMGNTVSKAGKISYRYD
jgi:hypothetical protein